MRAQKNTPMHDHAHTPRFFQCDKTRKNTTSSSISPLLDTRRTPRRPLPYKPRFSHARTDERSAPTRSESRSFRLTSARSTPTLQQPHGGAPATTAPSRGYHKTLAARASLSQVGYPSQRRGRRHEKMPLNPPSTLPTPARGGGPAVGRMGYRATRARSRGS